MTPRSPNVAHTGGAPPAHDGAHRRHGRWRGRRPRLSRLRTAPLLARTAPLLTRHIAATMPWGTLLTGCLAGIVYLTVLAHLTGPSPTPLGQGTVRLAFLPAVAGLAFVPRAPLRPLTRTTPVPAWVTPAGHLLLAAPVLALTCWAQLRIVASAVPPHSLIQGHGPAVYPMIAQLTGWCAVTVAVAACAGRSRYADLAGAIAAPAVFAGVAIAWYTPAIARLLVAPPASPHGVTIAWYAITAAALAVICVAMRDHWHRAMPGLRRPFPPLRGRP